jgi:hypothetical protein
VLQNAVCCPWSSVVSFGVFGAFGKKVIFWWLQVAWKRWKKQRGVDTIAKY